MLRRPRPWSALAGLPLLVLLQFMDMVEEAGGRHGPWGHVELSVSVILLIQVSPDPPILQDKVLRPLDLASIYVCFLPLSSLCL